jgi:hypothetical protein
MLVLAPRTHRTAALAVAAMLLLPACGRSGRGGGGGAAPPVDEPDPPPDPGLALRTPVHLSPLDYATLHLPTCLERTSAPVLPRLTEGWLPDGRLEEWAKLPHWPDDPAGDAPAGSDITRAAVARVGADLALAAAAHLDAGVTLTWEIGGTLVHGGSLVSEARRWVRWRAGTLEERIDGVWQAVAPTLGRAASGPDGIEILLSERLLGDVVAWPSWWVRAVTGPESDQAALADATASAIFPSLLGADGTPFVATRCTSWTTARAPVSFIDVQDTRAATRLKGFPIDEAAEQTSRLVRFTADAVADMLGKVPLPFTTLPVLATVARLGSLPDPFADPGGVGEAPVPSYRTLVLGVADLTPETLRLAPEGPIVEQTATTLFELALRQASPGAPDYMAMVFAAALLEHLVQEQFGRAYWLDAGVARLAPFVDRPDTAAPQPIGDRAHALTQGLTTLPAKDRATLLAATRAKISGLGRLLALDATAKELVDGWLAAARRTPPSSDPATILAALVSVVRTSGFDAAQRADHLSRLAAGWLTPDSYADGATPAALADTDFDGLFDALEARLGSAADKLDTDDDGWSDFGEVMAGTDPTSAGARPATLIPDGLFDDWLVLLPMRIHIDKSVARTCPVGADITHYAALASPDALLIGAAAPDFAANERVAEWQADIELTDDGRQLTLVATSGAHELVVQDSRGTVLKRVPRVVPLGRKAIEWTLDRALLGVTQAIDTPNAVRVRLRTLLRGGEGEQLCDETDWFAPNVTE